MLIDPRLDVPRGIAGIIYSDPDRDIDFFQTDNADDLIQSDDIIDGPIPSEPDTDLRAPSSFSVIEQKVRISPGGQTVVDVIIEIEDVEAIKDYETRITKIDVN